MNERIKELKYQAEALAYEEHKANCIKNGRDPSMPHANALNMTFEKFAELILKDCMTLFENAKVNQEDDVDYGLEEAQNIIKEQFGVKDVG